MTFNPNEHLMNLKGKQYLQVQWRLCWFREACPQGIITTEIVHMDLEKGVAVFRATIQDGSGGSATGYGSESLKDFGDYLEKAETKSIGRALAALGYGTQFAVELDEGDRVVDSPVEVVQRTSASRQPSPPKNTMETQTSIPTIAELQVECEQLFGPQKWQEVLAKLFREVPEDKDLTPKQRHQIKRNFTVVVQRRANEEQKAS